MIKTKKTLPVSEICQELVSLQRRRAEAMKCSIAIMNRTRSIVASHLGYKNSLEDADRKKLFKDSDTLIKSIRECPTFTHSASTIVRAMMMSFDSLEGIQHSYELPMKRLVKQLPVHCWVEKEELRGFGTLMLAIVVGECGDLNNYSNPGKLWKRMGCAPYTNSDGVTRMGATWRSKGGLTSDDWTAYGYCPRRRSIAYLIGTGIVRQNRVVEDEKETWRGPYYEVFEFRKAKWTKEHPEEEKPGHAHLHGMLCATKTLLRDLWRKWTGRGVDYDTGNPV
jgi:hypothetical protein